MVLLPIYTRFTRTNVGLDRQKLLMPTWDFPESRGLQDADSFLFDVPKKPTTNLDSSTLLAGRSPRITLRASIIPVQKMYFRRLAASECISADNVILTPKARNRVRDGDPIIAFYFHVAESVVKCNMHLRIRVQDNAIHLAAAAIRNNWVTSVDT